MQDTISNQSMLKVGTILRDMYRIDSYLSSGGFGNTYVATNIEFDERVAIKEFFMKGITKRDENQITVSVSNIENTNSFLEQKEKFKKEAQRIRKLNNPFIVKVHDLFEENGTTYYVMDYVDGENLAARLSREGQPMTETEVNKILPQILGALKTVHDAGIWHLDLKPANIMIDKAGAIKLIDFGASKQMNGQKGGATTSTAISYTNGYAPREQMEQNYDKFGPWTDFYALGATLYTLLTNKRPPLPTDIDDDISKDKHLVLPLPNGISKEMKSNILWLMQTNRNRRPQSIDEFISKMKEEIKPVQTSDDDMNEGLTISSEETLITGNKNEDKIIDASKGGNKINNKVQGQSKMKYGWLLIIVFFIILVGGIYFSYSKFSKYLSPIVFPVDSTEIVDTAKHVEKIVYDSPLGKYHTGPIDAQKRPHGLGEALFSDGSKYRGYFDKGVLTGKNSLFQYPNGDVFEGRFEENSLSEGKYTVAEDSSYFIGTFKNGKPDKGTWFNKNNDELNDYSGTDVIRLIKQYLKNSKGDNYAIPYDVFFNNKSLKEESDKMEMEEYGNYPYAKKYRAQLTIDGKPLGGIWYLALRGPRAGVYVFEMQSSTGREGMKLIEKEIREKLSGRIIKKDTKNVSIYSYYLYKVQNGYVLLDFSMGAGQIMVEIAVSQMRGELESRLEVYSNENSETDREAIKEFFGEN